MTSRFVDLGAEVDASARQEFDAGRSDVHRGYPEEALVRQRGLHQSPGAPSSPQADSRRDGLWQEPWQVPAWK